MIDSPKIALGITAVAYLLLIVVILNRHDWDPSYFINVGDRFTDRARMPANVSVLSNSDGYDGQYYYRFALDPFTSTRTDFGITVHNTGYRQQRILYPLIVWALSWGRPQPMPAVMIGVNFLALCALAWVGARFAQSVKQHALWGLAFPGYAGFVLTLSKDLAEIITGFLVLEALWLLRRGRHWIAAFVLALGVLSRETALLVAVGVLCSLLIDTCEGKPRRAHVWVAFVVPVLVWVTWQWILLLRWGEIPVFAGPPNIGVPLVGFFGLLRSVSDVQTASEQLWFFELCFIMGFAISVLYALRASTAPRHETIAWLLYLALASSLTSHVWVEDWSYLRALTELYVLGVIVLLSSASRIKLFILPWALVLWVLVFQWVGRTY